MEFSSTLTFIEKKNCERYAQISLSLCNMEQSCRPFLFDKIIKKFL